MNWRALQRPISALYFVDANDTTPTTLVFAFWAMCPERGLVYMTAAGNVFPASRLNRFEVLP